MTWIDYGKHFIVALPSAQVRLCHCILINVCIYIYIYIYIYCIAQNFDGGNFDVFDAFQLDCQNLTRQIV